MNRRKKKGTNIKDNRGRDPLLRTFPYNIMVFDATIFSPIFDREEFSGEIEPTRIVF
jgi:hypothetical protein